MKTNQNIGKVFSYWNIIEGGSKYNVAGQTVKNTLTSTPNNWDIVDGGLE